MDTFSGPLAGVRVIEVASWWFVPSASAILADWGADVVKIEPPLTGDPMRGMRSHVADERGADMTIAQPNRGKRSVGIDLKTREGRELLYELVRDADVFITSYLPKLRVRLGIDVGDLRAVNPGIVYARGSGQGVRGPEAERGGFDLPSFWSRGGIAAAVSGPDAVVPTRMRGAMGDSMAGMSLAGGVAAGLVQRERTGVAPVVDVSLLATATWMQSQEIVLNSVHPDGIPEVPRNRPANPLTGYYRTGDGRWLTLCMLQAQRFWAPLCTAVGAPELGVDPRFVNDEARERNIEECVAALDAVFATRTLDEWRPILDGQEGVWAAVQKPGEVLTDVQVVANGYVLPLTGEPQDSALRLVNSPVQFDERTPASLGRAPLVGEHTDKVLLEGGRDFDDLIPLKIAGAIT